MVDLEAFARAHKGEGVMATETDRVVCLAIGILRIQLAELAKVRQLCHEFCDRYIANLRSKLSQEQLLGFSADSDEEGDYGRASETSPGDGGRSPDHSLRPSRASLGDLGPVATLQTPSGPVTVRLRSDGVPLISRPAGAAPVRPPTSLNMDAFRFPLPLFLPFSSASILAAASQPSPSPREEERGSSGSPTGPESNNNRKTTLPPDAVEVLKTWLFKHASHPYPSDAEKRGLALETNLNLMQVNNWFINARRRILQPLATDTPSSPDPDPSESSPSKRAKSAEIRSEVGEVLNGIPRPTLTSAQRYWPFTRDGNTSSKSLDLLAEKLANKKSPEK